MKNVDYIIVGGGYAGLFFAHQLIKNNKSFVLFSDRQDGASEVSAGMINPVVLKKFTTFWKAQEQIDCIHETLNEMKPYLGRDYFLNERVHRIFHDEPEKDLWLKKANNPDLSPFLSTDFQTLKVVENPFETGTVLQSGRLDVQHFFQDYFHYLSQNQLWIEERFKYNLLDVQNKIYQDWIFKHLVFCEGFRVKDNPYFNFIPVQPNKGHHLVVELLQPLQEQVAIKKKHFLFPIQGNLYYYGGTYDRIHTDPYIDEEAVAELERGLQEFYPYPYKIVDVEVGFRPTVKDRRAIVGRHPNYDQLFVFNGLGARGVLNACYFAKELYELIEKGKPVNEEVSLKRFVK